MKPEAQRIAIAEACGWTSHIMKCGNQLWVSPKHQLASDEEKEKKGFYLPGIPWFESDLNALLDAENTLTYQQQKRYVKIITELCQYTDTVQKPFAILHATAAQRAEAFLRTLNLWKDES